MELISLLLFRLMFIVRFVFGDLSSEPRNFLGFSGFSETQCGYCFCTGLSNISVSNVYLNAQQKSGHTCKLFEVPGDFTNNS
jgi:hypothetical protein